MEICSVKGVAWGGVIFASGERGKEAVDVLHVGDIATDAEDGGGVFMREGA